MILSNILCWPFVTSLEFFVLYYSFSPLALIIDLFEPLELWSFRTLVWNYVQDSKFANPPCQLTIASESGWELLIVNLVTSVCTLEIWVTTHEDRVDRLILYVTCILSCPTAPTHELKLLNQYLHTCSTWWLVIKYRRLRSQEPSDLRLQNNKIRLLHVA